MKCEGWGLAVEKGNTYACLCVSLFQVSIQNCDFDVDQNCHLDVDLSNGALNEKYMRAQNIHLHPGFGISRVGLSFGEVCCGGA